MKHVPPIFKKTKPTGHLYFVLKLNVNESRGLSSRSYTQINEAPGWWKCFVAVSVEWRYKLDDGWHSECAFHLICPVFHSTDARPFILLALNSYNWRSKCTEPLSTAGSCWEGIWAALLSERECVCRVHQSVPSPGELNKLIGRLVAASCSLCASHSQKDREENQLKTCPLVGPEDIQGSGPQGNKSPKRTCKSW